MDKSLIIFLAFAIVIFVFVIIQTLLPLTKTNDEEPDNSNLSTLNIEVSIPCPGHAPLIKSYLQQVDGIESIKFKLPNYFNIKYDQNKTTKEKILSIDIFAQYPAREVQKK